MDIYNINIQKEYFEKYKYFFEKDKQIELMKQQLFEAHKISVASKHGDEAEQ